MRGMSQWQARIPGSWNKGVGHIWWDRAAQKAYRVVEVHGHDGDDLVVTLDDEPTERITAQIARNRGAVPTPGHPGLTLAVKCD